MIVDEQNTSSESTNITQFSYSVGRFNILLERDLKTEIIEQRKIFPIPHAPDWCRGMISLRGKLMPVLNLHRILADTSSKVPPWLLIIESSPLPQIAIGIDALPIQQQINPEKFEPVDESLSAAWLHQQGTLSGKTLLLADHHQLFEQLINDNDTTQNPLGIEA